jgi:probable DNA repair protein
MEEILSRLGEGAAALTATLRQAHHLRWRFDRHQQKQGRRAWRAPRIEPLSAWVAKAWEHSLVSEGAAGQLQLLSPTQSRQLWQSLPVVDGPLTPALTGLIESAWRLSHDWQITPARIREVGRGTDAEQFGQLAEHYAQTCRDKGWLDRVSAMSALLPEIAAGPAWLDPSLLFVGFDVWTPGLAGLAAALETGGCPTTVSQPTRREARVYQASFSDQIQETDALVAWAAARIGAQPDSSVGVVVPDLLESGELVRRRLLDAVDPHWRQRARALVPVTGGANRQLAQLGLVHAALLGLELPTARLDYQRLGQLLRSPYLGQGEAAGRARLDRWLRERGQRQAELVTVVAQAGEFCPQLAARLESVMAQAPPRRLEAADWSRWIRSHLERLGWPGKGALDRDEQTALRAWQVLLDNFVSCGLIHGAMSWGEARRLLTALARVEPVSEPAQARGIQILNPKEALGQSFDALWIGGLHGDAWPPPARPNPLVPVSLQRKAGVPAASPQAYARQAQGVLERLWAASAQVICSQAGKRGEEHLTPSPALRDLPPVAADALLHTATQREQIAWQQETEIVADPAPALVAAERPRGGSRILQLQAACPARAFFEVRLHATELRIPPVGIDGAMRGQILHQALEELHQGLAEAELVASDPAAAALLPAISQRSLQHRLAPTPFNRVLSQLEEARVQTLLGVLLNFEAGRSGYKTVAAERALCLDLGSLPLRLRADRVDEFDDGARLIIDYKSGAAPRPADWTGARPAEPQLPLYALAGEAQAVAIFRLTEEGLTVDGVAAMETDQRRIRSVGKLTDGRLTSWEELLADWTQVLTALADEFVAGHVGIDPHNRDLAAGVYAPLTRVFEQDPGN